MDCPICGADCAWDPRRAVFWCPECDWDEEEDDFDD